MADAPTSAQARMDRVARLTLALGGFMLLLLILLLFTLSDDARVALPPTCSTSLFLTSIGIVIGASITWLNAPPDPPASPINQRWVGADAVC